MYCPFCGTPKSQVIATRHKKKPLQTLRYCQCTKCRRKWRSLERAIAEGEVLFVE